MNRRRWMRTRRRLAFAQMPELLSLGPMPTVEEIRGRMPVADLERLFGERGPEQFASGGIVGGPDGPELLTLPKGCEVTYLGRAAS